MKLSSALSLGSLVFASGLLASAVACSNSANGSGFGTSGGASAEAGPDFLKGNDGGEPDADDLLGVGCGGGIAKSQKAPVFFEFCVDGSGSMDSLPKVVVNGVSMGVKRAAQESALKAAFEDIKNQSVDANGNVIDNTVGVGMLFFGEGGTYPKADDVGVKFVDQFHLAALWGRVGKFPGGGTPTFEALTGAYQVLENLTPAAPLLPKGKKVVVLMSDGEPNGNEAGIMSMVEAKAKQRDPITTFSVGVGAAGAGYDPVFMANVAIKGGAAKPGCDPNDTVGTNSCHFQITPGTKTLDQLRADFVDALTQIRYLANACDIELVLVDKDGRPADPKTVGVYWTDKDDETKVVGRVSKDPKNGWSYDDDANPTRIILNGAACDEARTTETKKVQIKLGCKAKGG